MPFRITFIPVGCVDDGVVKRQIEQSSGVEMVRPCPPHGRALAVVGGGPSVAEHLEELRSWAGDIWAINNTAAWLADRGIESTLISVDPDAWVIDKRGVTKALLASCCHPSAFEGVQAQRFHLAEHVPGGIGGGASTASRAPVLALRMGYREVTFYGCESSFVTRDHVDRDEQKAEQLIVRAGRDYRTTPPLLLQCECLSDLIRDYPQVFKERSGGLLRAMVDHPDWEIAAVSAALKETLIRTNGDQGLYESRYEWRA